MNRFTNILVQHDPARPHVLERALQFARGDNAKLTIVDVVPNLRSRFSFLKSGADEVVAKLTKQKQEGLERLQASLAGESLEIEMRLLNSPTSAAIVSEVERNHFDLVVRSAKGPYSRRVGFFGTTGTRLMRSCPCPVLLLKTGHDGPFQRIAAAVEADPADESHSELDHEIMEMAIRLRELDDTELQVIHAWSVYGASVLKEHMRPEDFEELTNRTRAHGEKVFDDLLVKYNLGVGQAKMQLLQGEPGEVIPRYCNEKDIDLLIAGTVGRTGISGFLMGNTAEEILNRVECSLLTLKPAEFSSSSKAS